MDSSWPWIAAGLVLVVLLAVGWTRYRRKTDEEPAPGTHVRFAAAAAISPVQTELLLYLMDAFAGRPVLFRVPLSQLVTPRGAGDRLQTQRRLAEQAVDFVVCDREGKAIYAFELDAAHEDTEQAGQDAAQKHRVLTAAGIRLIRIKRSTRGMPSPREFRQRLRSATLQSDAAATGRTPLDRSAPAPAARTPKALHSEPMSLTDLMDLPAVADDDPWGADRRH